MSTWSHVVWSCEMQRTACSLVPCFTEIGFVQVNGGGEFRFFLLKIPKCQLETPCLLGHPCRSCRNSLRWRPAAQFRYQMTTAVRAACSGPSSWWPLSWRQSERRQPPSAVSVSTVAHRTLQHDTRTRPRDLASSRVALCFWLLSLPMFLKVEEYHWSCLLTPDVAAMRVTA